MKPQLLKVASNPSSSFNVRQDRLPYVNNRWHYHREIELIYIKEGNGTQFIGDNISMFHSGDVVLVGSDLPHYWSFDDDYFRPDSIEPNVFVTHFCDNFWGQQFLDIPENLPIKNILESARRGIRVAGPAKASVGALLEEMYHADGTGKILLLLQALIAIANSGDHELLSSPGFRPKINDSDNSRLNAVYQYVFDNYKRKITIEEMATVAHMSPNSFSRYFRLKTGKTYSDFLIELRVGVACKLLIENRLSIKQIFYESGFKNITCFHKYFKMVMGKTPLVYQKEFISHNH